MSGASARHTFLALVATCFAAGVAVGLAIPAILAQFETSESDDPDRRFVDQLADRYDLTPRQAREIRMVLQSRDHERRELLADPRELPPALRQRVLKINRRADERIKFVLTPEQRARFLRDAGPDPESDDGKE